MKVLNRCVCILNDCYLHHQVGSEIESLNSKILNLKRNSAGVWDPRYNGGGRLKF